MSEPDLKIPNKSSEAEIARRRGLVAMLKSTPIPDSEIHKHLGLYVNRQLMARMLWMHEVYTKVLHTPGVIMEFGVRWGQNLALFQSFRAIYEPYNYTRKVIGFDTFEGFTGIAAEDGHAKEVSEGAFNVTPGYEKYLAELLQYHEDDAPVAHIKKHELVKGDASATIERYLEANPHTIVSLAYFNMDIYKPTKDCLEALKKVLTKGSVVAFDELVCQHFPGETLALRDALGLDKYRLIRHPHNPYPAYLVIE